jgi:hypothetical protein
MTCRHCGEWVIFDAYLQLHIHGDALTLYCEPGNLKNQNQATPDTEEGK